MKPSSTSVTRRPLTWLSLFVALLTTPSLADLRTEIHARIERVAEFKAIRDEAKARGLQAYLFGGTASSFAHYVRWDLMRESGDKRFKSERFDYNYLNIYSDTQDLDIVVDGSVEQALDFGRWIQSKYNYFQGKRERWEIRTLRVPIGKKNALLDDWEFQHQHTDSHSVGMIELTADDPNLCIRDLREWNNTRMPKFLADVMSGTLHYYYSPLHHQTPRYKQGMNPPIFSVIRYLIKAFQFDLKILPQDFIRIKQLIRTFKPKRDLADGRARFWIEKNAPKLVQSAVNIEYAVKTLDSLELRKKLVALGKRKKIGSMSWVLNREPLRTAPITQEGPSRTAREHGLDIVVQEVRSITDYESLARSHSELPNVFASDRNGLITYFAKKDPNSIAAQYRIRPDARENSDFKRIPDGVLVRNRAALTLLALENLAGLTHKHCLPGDKK